MTNILGVYSCVTFVPMFLFHLVEKEGKCSQTYQKDMSTDDSGMPLSEDTKTPQVYKLDIKESSYNVNKNEVNISKPVSSIGLTKAEVEIEKEPEWWRKHVSYQIFTPSFYDSNNDGIGDFNGIREKLNDLRKNGVKTIWVTPVITVQKDDFIPLDVIDLTSVDERFGTMNDLKSLIDELHDLEMFKSAKSGSDYVDYYIWKKASEVKNDPNYVAEEGEENAYLAYEGKDPILNWRNPAVRQSIFEIAKNFLDMGIDGFHVGRISQLIKSEGDVAQSMLNDFIGSLRDYVNNNETLNNREITVFSTLNDLTEPYELNSPKYGLPNLTYVIDNSITGLNNETCSQGVAQCLHSTLLASFERFNTTQFPYAWQFTDYHVSRLSTRFDKATATLLNFVQLSLPGIVQLYYGQELSFEDSTGPTNKFTGLMQWNSSEYGGFTAGSQKPFFSTTPDYKEDNFEIQFSNQRSPLKTVKAMARLRQRDNIFALGEIHFAPLTQDVILFNRFRLPINGTTGGAYLVGANFGASNAEVNVTAVLPNDFAVDEGEIAIVTPNVDKYLPRSKISLSDKIVLGPKHGIIIKI
ncbi:hypothetical protein X798_03849 [Onchocerca flexuosa]|uniref:Glycosyl hydrolase family 13 catalytic domain-containing protein n=1 Tax=Onchocerca flexuosa TaxID=387005 RepID=A0A238BV11_9BILA|nr:hypothetical protein X798_03849 [Onchocerca flexuosa]